MGTPGEQQFPPPPARWRRQRVEPDVYWILASRVVPFLLGAVMVPMGFAVITNCTDFTPNHDCGGYNTMISFGIIVQFLLFALAMVASRRSLRTTWLTKGIVFASIATLVGAFAFGA
jgi:uncharacterized BrkB/YihY/UPF0761 family membrane protein